MNKVWLVTGASRGFGFEIAKAALTAGDRVVATSRSAASVAAALGTSDTLLALDLDVTRRDQVDTAVEAAMARFGRIDILVNNAGYSQLGALEECSFEQIEAQFATNVIGLIAATKAVLPIMRAQRSGHIFNFSSIAGVRAAPGACLYSASKFAVEGLSVSLAADVEPFGIKMTIIEPGAFRTEFLDDASTFTPATIIDAYDETIVGNTRRYVRQLKGVQQGDPVKLAQAIVDLSREAEPPLWFAAGADAVGVVEYMLAQRRDNLEATRARSSALTIDG